MASAPIGFRFECGVVIVGERLTLGIPSAFCDSGKPDREIGGALARCTPVLDGWPSGLRRTPGKRVGSQGSREFESRLIRSFCPRAHHESVEMASLVKERVHPKGFAGQVTCTSECLRWSSDS